MCFIYRVFVLLYLAGIRLASLFTSKARQWLAGRVRWEPRMREQAADLYRDRPSARTAWFHCASLGEFEQGRPVLEQFRKDHPDWVVLLSFFSPSGYAVRKDYAHADAVVYLPLDTPGTAARFLDIWKPSLAVFVKYEYWYGYIRALAKEGVYTCVISAIFRPGQVFFKFYGGWFRRQLALMSRIFVQDETSAELLIKHGIDQVTVSGDTRFDRVYALQQNEEKISVAETFAGEHFVMVAGSTWAADEKRLMTLLRECKHPFRLIIAPHEVDDGHIRSLQEQAGEQGILYSRAGNDEARLRAARVLIIDRIGLLSKLYRYGHMAYVGGGFGQGIHNILEAATYGIPVIFGPRHEKFAEALDLLRLGGAFAVGGTKELRKITEQLLANSGRRKTAGAICRKYVEEQRGATETILKHIGKAMAEFGHPGQNN